MPHTPSIKVPVKVAIKQGKTGETRHYETDLYHFADDEEPHIWIWTEGNYSCDCNRSNFFHAAAGEPPDPDRQCSDGEYRVRIVGLEGKVYLDEIAES